MSRVQLAINVDVLESAVSFYSKLFATEPAKVREGYANFAIDSPPLKLVLFEQPGKGGTINHLGVEVDSTEAVGADQTRLALDGLATVTEEGVACCYARQAKVWGRRSLRRALGDLYGPGGRGDARRSTPHGRPRDRRDLLRGGGRRHGPGRRLLLLLS